MTAPFRDICNIEREKMQGLKFIVHCTLLKIA